jgi:hypothetical protein
MIRMFVRHRVSDFKAWKKGYDAFKDARQRLGVRGAAVFQGAPDKTDVTVWHDFDTLAAGQAFAKSKELESAMKTAGVQGQPQIWFADQENPG